MPILAIFTCMLYGAISGSAPGTTAAVGAMCFPLLVRLGYDRVFSAAIIVGAGCLGTVIPPSIQVTGMGVLSGGLELVALYKLAAIMGIACGVMIMIYSYVYCLRHGNGDQALINGKVTSLAWVLLVFRVSLPSYRYSHSWSRVPLAPCVGIKSCKSERKSEKTDVFDVKKVNLVAIWQTWEYFTFGRQRIGLAIDIPLYTRPRKLNLAFTCSPTYVIIQTNRLELHHKEEYIYGTKQPCIRSTCGEGHSSTGTAPLHPLDPVGSHLRI